MNATYSETTPVYAVVRIKGTMRKDQEGFPYIEDGDFYYLNFFLDKDTALKALMSWKSSISAVDGVYEIERYMLYELGCTIGVWRYFKKGRFKQQRYKQLVNDIQYKKYVCDTEWTESSIGYMTAIDEQNKTTEIEMVVVHDPLPRKNKLGLKSLEFDLGFVKCQIYDKDKEDECLVGEYITETKTKFVLKIDEFLDGRNYDPETLKRSCKQYVASFCTTEDMLIEYGMIQRIEIRSNKKSYVLYKKQPSKWAV